LKQLPFANALSFVTGVIYVICALGLTFAQDLYVSYVNSFFHGINLTALITKEMTLVSTITGLVTAVISAWLVGYLFAYCYNWCGKKFK